ncbi:MAG: nucleotidyltransferase family protein [Clostridia bacterium]|nr:nucleotidyltransferase family protein [Clostridia bacterium]
MRIAGIIAEYNPFHNGHALHIEKTREPNGGCEATHVVAVMSGSFVQRGEPAILSKFDRAKAALAGGVDLVIELPVPFCLASAEGFARGAVSLLDALGCVDVLSFGSESGVLPPLQKAITVMESPRFSSLLKYHLSMGISFAEAQQKALAEIAGTTAASVLETPNNTLGIEYLKALQAIGSAIQPFTVKRTGVAHDGMTPMGDLASASYLRTLLQSDRLLNALPYMPAGCAAVLSDAAEDGRAPVLAKTLDRAVLAQLRRLSLEELQTVPQLSEGLENRVHNAIRKAGSLDELENSIKTKRYPLTRIRRLIWSAFLGITEEHVSTPPPYIRVLAANERGKEILSVAKPAAPLLYRASQVATLSPVGQRLWELETRATDLHALACPVPRPCGTDQTTGLIR